MPLDLVSLFAQPETWAALITLVIMEVVLGIDNLIFVSILSNKLDPAYRRRARQIGIGLALIMRLVLLSLIGVIIALKNPLFELNGHAFSWRDLILIGGGLFLIYKAVKEIHNSLEHKDSDDAEAAPGKSLGFGAAIIQIIALDMVFSVDSILTAVGMTPHVPIMMVAVIVSVGVMLFAANPIAEFIGRHPSIVMLALGFLLMIGTVLIAEGLGAHVDKGYIYAAMAFASLVEALNLMTTRKKKAH